MSESKSAPDLIVERKGPVLFATLNREEKRNALSLKLLAALGELLDEIETDRSIRALVLQGAGKHFCSGGDVGDMAAARESEEKVESLNRSFGHFLERFEACACVTLVLVEGTALGGGFGLACTADIALCTEDSKMGMPETRLGLIPAQIAPFVVKRIGLSQAKALVLTGRRVSGVEAGRLQIVHEVVKDRAQLDAACDRHLEEILKCAPNALRVSKALLLEELPQNERLDKAASAFTKASRSEEGEQGMLAFIQKSKAPWVKIPTK